MYWTARPRRITRRSFIDDTTPEQHLISAVRGVRALVRNAGGKPLYDFLGALWVCGVDV